jgi:hypothetical protein
MKSKLNRELLYIHSFSYFFIFIDLALQYLYSFVFDVVHEELSDSNSFAFRPFRSPCWVLEAVEFKILISDSFLRFPKIVIILDVIRVFNNLNVEWVLDNISKVKLSGKRLKIVPKIILKHWLSKLFFCFSYTEYSLSRLFLYNSSSLSKIIENLVLNNLELYIVSSKEFLNFLPKSFSIEQYRFFSLIRYGVSMVFFCYSSYFLSLLLTKIVDFLMPRGLFFELKTFNINRFSKKSFHFLGFEFCLVLKRDSFLFHTSPSMLTVRVLLNKLFLIFEKTKNFESCFIKINKILKRWLIFYSFGSSNNVFRKLRFRLWRMAYNYFFNNYKRLPQFKIKKSLSFYIWSKHLKAFRDIKYWWNISSKDSNRSRYKVFDLFLQYPCLYNTSKFSFFQLYCCFNAYHPEDQEFLSSKALVFKGRVFKRILKLTKGRCALCYWNLFYSEEESSLIDIYNLRFLEYNNKFLFYDFKFLCLLCYKEVLRSLNSCDWEKITYYQKKRIFSFSLI